jgi:hypothetical protein
MKFKNEAEYNAFVASKGLVQLYGLVPVKKPSRERNQKIEVGKEKFDSKWEYTRYCQLKMMERGGLISGLKRQVEFILAPAVVIGGRKRPPLRYFLDFQYQSQGVTAYEDAKGKEGVTDTYRIKRHLMVSVHGIQITEVRQ